MNLKDLIGKTIVDVKLSGQRISENDCLCPSTYSWMEIVFQDGTHLSIEPCTSDFVDILLDDSNEEDDRESPPRDDRGSYQGGDRYVF